MNRNNLALTFLLTLHFGCVLAQDTLSSLTIGQWQQHLPWALALYATQDETRVWYATDWSIVEVDKSDLSPKFITKVEGLSDVGVQLVKYNPATKKLFIAYANSNIDYYDVNSGETLNLPFIKKNINLIGDKKIYDLYFNGADAYVSAGFGMLKMSMINGETDYTVFTPFPVHGTALLDGYIYIGTEKGVYRLPQNDPTPADFNRWEPLGSSQGFPSGSSISAMIAFDGHIWLGTDRSLYRYKGSDQAELIASHPQRDVVFFSTEGTGLVIGWRKDFGGSVDYVQKNSTFREEVHWGCDAGKPRFAIEDGSRKFWFADFDAPLRSMNLNTGVCERFSYNAPLWHQTPEISIARGKVYVASPGAKSDFSPLGDLSRGVYFYEDGVWQYLSSKSNPELPDQECYKDTWRITGHPQQEKFYVGSFIGGLIEASDDRKTLKCFTQYNSILQNAGNSGLARTAISGMAFDKDQNLWICNYGATAPVAVLKSDGTLKNFAAAPNRNPIQIAIDQNGYKWFVLGFNAGIMVYDSGKDIDSPTDDRWKVFTTANSNLPSNTTNSLAVDLDGDVWVGTNQGVVTFECGSNVFDDNCKGRRRIVNVDGFNGYLLETEDVRTIAVDGANRKWFGTTNGIFVQSPDGLEQVARFTSTNSPLFDNIITDIAVNPDNGEVWIGTEKGILSYRSDATQGGKVNTRQSYAYPNPVMPDYDGPIAIYGLARDANVKITDLAGNLVYEGKALGGQAVWNGRDYSGKRAASGVYLIYATSVANFDEPDAVVTKLVLLN